MENTELSDMVRWLSEKAATKNGRALEYLDEEAKQYLWKKSAELSEKQLDEILDDIIKEVEGMEEATGVIKNIGRKSVAEKVASKSRKYSEEEIKNILDSLRGDGFKNNPLRQAYEEEVGNLKSYGEELLESGMSEEEVAKTLNQARRDLGIKYKDMTPQPLRDYIYEINMNRYGGDKLGPTYEWLIDKGKSNMDIINSSSRPNPDIDELLIDFEEWLRGQ